jgi:hypothetical protein
MQTTSPLLRRLSLVSPYTFVHLEDPDFAPFSFPSLQHVEWDADGGWIDQSWYSLFAGCPLLSFSVIVGDPDDEEEPELCEDALPIATLFPPTLKSILLSFQTSCRPIDADNYIALRAKQNITVSLSWTPTDHRLRRAHLDEKNAQQLRTSIAKRSIDETADWLRQRSDALCEAEDWVGLAQLAKSMVRARQMQRWETQ